MQRSELLNPIDHLPSYSQWMSFLQEQKPAQVTIRPKKINERTSSVNAAYRTPKGVRNTLEFYNQDPDRSSIDMRVSVLRQNYSDPSDPNEVTINQTIYSHYLDSILTISKPTDNVDHIVVSSTSYFSSKREWVDNQEVFMLLNEGYLARLKKEGVLPVDAECRVWINRGGNDVSVTIGKKTKGRYKTLPLTEEVLRRIYRDVNLEFDTQQGLTTGNIGNYAFSQTHTRVTSLDPDRIWNALTGSDEQAPFIFPVKVTKESK